MKQLTNIITGFWFWLNPFTPRWVKEQSQKRMEKCRICPQNIQNTCRLCGCYLPAKTRSPEENCPELKWGEMEKPL